MAKRFAVNYPDGFTKHVSEQRKDEMLRSGSIRANGDSFAFVGELETFHSLQSLGMSPWTYAKMTSNPQARYYPGTFVVKRPPLPPVFERLESPHAMAERLSRAPEAA